MDFLLYPALALLTTAWRLAWAGFAVPVWRVCWRVAAMCGLGWIVWRLESEFEDANKGG